jgi:AcrR family transcriptional regulator
MPRTGRRPGRTETRERIVDVARREFGERGYDNVSVRAVATAASVDPALVYHYFGTKQRLFVAAMELPIDVQRVLPALLAGPPEETGLRLAHLFVGIWEDPAARAPLLGVLRSAVTDPGAAEMIREFVLANVVGPIVAALGTPDPELRVTLIGSQVIGLALARYILKIEPLASATPDTLVAAVAPTLQRYLMEPLGLPGVASAAGPETRGQPDRAA